MNFTIPDKLPKLFVLIGMILGAYGIFNLDKIQVNFNEKYYDYQILVDSVNVMELNRVKELDSLKIKALIISKKYNVPNLIIDKDSVVEFEGVSNDNKPAILAYNEIESLWVKYVESGNKLRLMNKKLVIKTESIKREKEKEPHSYYMAPFIVGLLFFVVGLFAWIGDEPVPSPIKQTDKIYTFCQSCGKNFSSIRKYGTEKNNDLNFAFCYECYKDGEFNSMTKEEFIEQSQSILKNKGWLTRRRLKAKFESLERWKNSEY